MKLLSSLYILVILFSMLALTACTFLERREIKSKASDVVLENVRKTLEAEQRLLIAEKNTRGKDFAEYVQNHTEVEVTDMREISATQYQLEMKIRTVNPEARRMILEMLAKMDDRTARAFNFSNALGLMQQQRPDLVIEVEQRATVNLRQVNGEWVSSS
jgi:cell division protein FtsL